MTVSCRQTVNHRRQQQAASGKRQEQKGRSQSCASRLQGERKTKKEKRTTLEKVNKQHRKSQRELVYSLQRE